MNYTFLLVRRPSNSNWWKLPKRPNTKITNISFIDWWSHGHHGANLHLFDHDDLEFLLTKNHNKIHWMYSALMLIVLQSSGGTPTAVNHRGFQTEGAERCQDEKCSEYRLSTWNHEMIKNTKIDGSLPKTNSLKKRSLGKRRQHRYILSTNHRFVIVLFFHVSHRTHVWSI